MKKDDFAVKLAQNLEISQKDAQKIKQVFIKTLADELAETGKVQFTGFGTFETKTRNAREYVNPKTKEKTGLDESIAVNFKSSKTLKERLKNNENR